MEIKLSNNDYFPVIKPGSYNVIICKLGKNGWEAIKQSAATCTMNISATSAPIPYASDVMVINDGQDVLQGSTFKAKVTLGCLNGDFDGYIRVNIAHGLSYNVRSEYVAVSLKEGETAEFTLDCNTKSTIALNKYRLAMTYNDADKKKIGDISNNTLTFPGNGYFWVCDETSIENVESDSATTVCAGGNCIKVLREDAVITIYSTDGREVYKGTDNTISVASGLYIVTVQQGGTTTATKVFVK